MSGLTLIGISLGLAMDAFAVSIAAGLALEQITPRHVFRVAFHFGLFQWMMPVLGYLAGTTLAAYIADYDHWVAFALLGYVGGKMLWEAGRSNSAAADRDDPTRGLTLLTLSIATSVDALAVGLSMAFLGVTVWFPAAVIGVVTATLSALGILFGGRLGSRWGRWAEIVGGCVLLAIGLRILATHTAEPPPPVPHAAAVRSPVSSTQLSIDNFAIQSGAIDATCHDTELVCWHGGGKMLATGRSSS